MTYRKDRYTQANFLLRHEQMARLRSALLRAQEGPGRVTLNDMARQVIDEGLDTLQRREEDQRRDQMIQAISAESGVDPNLVKVVIGWYSPSDGRTGSV